MNYLNYDSAFDQTLPDEDSKVFFLTPRVFTDARGSFTEVLNASNQELPKWMHDFSWIKQLNRSTSCENTCRGLHAQHAPSCQGKLVECVLGLVYDIIVDARPESKTFGKAKAYLLDSQCANKLWVPRGFLHGFIVGSMRNNEQCIFQYAINGGTYDKKSEFSVNICSMFDAYTSDSTQSSDLLSNLISKRRNDLIMSEKDVSGLDYQTFMKNVQTDWIEQKILWYK